MPIGSRLVGAGTGALTGIGAGSAFGPIGAGVGGVIGAATGYFGAKGSSKKNLLDQPDYERTFEKYTPQQKQLLDQIFGVLSGQGGPQGGILGDIFGEKGFESYAAPLKRQFEEEIVPGLAERFSGGLGTGGASAQRSSAFQQQLAQAGKDLTTNLGLLRSQQQNSLIGPLLNQYLQPQFSSYYEPGQASGSAQALGQLGGQLAGEFGPQGIKYVMDLLKNIGRKQIGTSIDAQGKPTGPIYNR